MRLHRKRVFPREFVSKCVFNLQLFVSRKTEPKRDRSENNQNVILVNLISLSNLADAEDEEFESNEIESDE